MKKSLKIILPVTVLMLGGAGFATYSLLSKSSPDKDTPQIVLDTKDVALNAVVNITAEWNYEEMKKLEHPLLSPQMAKQGKSFEEFFKLFRTLGELKSPVRCTFLEGNETEEISYADYGCNAIYEKEKASIFIKLIRNKDTEGKFLIGAFRVNSPLFETLRK